MSEDSAPYDGDILDYNEALEEAAEEGNPWESAGEYLSPKTLDYINELYGDSEDSQDSDSQWSTEVLPDSIEESEAESEEASPEEIEDILNDEGEGEEEEEEEEDAEAESEDNMEDHKRIPADMHKREYDPSEIVEKKDISGGQMVPDDDTANEIKVRNN